MIQIIPAILATAEEDYKTIIYKIRSCPELVEGWVHIDFMDNKFVQNESIGPEIVDKYKLEFPLKLEAHLMVEDPKSWITELVKVSNIKRIVFHVEIKKDIEEVVKLAKDHGLEAGLAVNPETSVNNLEQFINKVDIVLVMGVHPGFQGQDFIPETLEKAKEVLRLRSGQIRFKIEFDGGVSENNIKKIIDAGADIAVIGSGLFKYDNLEEGLEKIRKAAYG